MSKLWKPTRRQVLTGAAGLIAAPAIVRAGSMPLLGAGTVTAVAPTFTTLDPAHTTPTLLTLSGGNLIATHDSSSTDAWSRSIASHSTGAYYYSGFMSLYGGDNGFGIQDSTTPTSFLGSDIHSVGYFGSGNVFFNGGNIGPVASSGPADVVDIAIYLATSKIWIRINGGNWNNDILANQNPAIGSQVGGLSFSGISTPVFATIGMTISNSVATLNFGASAYTNAAPSGYSNW